MCVNLQRGRFQINVKFLPIQLKYLCANLHASCQDYILNAVKEFLADSNTWQDSGFGSVKKAGEAPQEFATFVIEHLFVFLEIYVSVFCLSRTPNRDTRDAAPTNLIVWQMSLYPITSSN